MPFALITGGSRGIGAQAVRAFCQAGYQVAFFYVTHHGAARRLAEETGSLALCCDVAEQEQVASAIQGLPSVDVLVNNAGISHVGLISQITPQQWDRLFAVNVKGIYHCVQAVLPGMLQRQAGCIINVTSMWGQVGASCEAAYSATKGAVIALTKALAKELGPSGIRVNGVSPGVIDTEMNHQLSAQDKEVLREDTPLLRLGTPADVAQAMLYLSRAEFVTGQILPVNGGFVI